MRLLGWHGVSRSKIHVYVLCAWCNREGQFGYLGEREPLDNPLPTHGLCASHRSKLLESMPSRSFPEVEVLIVVRRDCLDSYERLSRLFAGTTRARVILDRRVAERRVLPDQVSPDRRCRRRRIREGRISPLDDFLVVRFTPRAPVEQQALALS